MRPTGFLTWERGVAIDVTGLDSKKIESIANLYTQHFLTRFPMQGEGGGSWQSLVKHNDSFLLVMAVDQNIGYRAAYGSKHFGLVIDQQVIGFGTDVPSAPFRAAIRDSRLELARLQTADPMAAYQVRCKGPQWYRAMV